MLMALIEARGAVVGKDALMARVWPGRIIEENSLVAQIAALRGRFTEGLDTADLKAARALLDGL